MAESMIERSASKDLFDIGVRVGGRAKSPDDVIGEIREFCSSPLVSICYLKMPAGTTAEHLVEWAKEFKKTKTRFTLSVVPHNLPLLTKENVEKIRAAAGEYYVGSSVPGLGELGTKTSNITYQSHYKEHPEKEMVDNLEDAFADYIDGARKKVEDAREIFSGTLSMTEATALLKYMYPTGIDTITAEVMNENLNFQIAYARGAARGYKNERWGNLLAHEWYGGLRNDDPLKYKRLKLAYDFLYMSGSKRIFIESGEQSIISYGYNYTMDHEFCKTYRRIREDFTRSILNDERPSAFPLCRVGILHGNLDPYVGFASSSLMYHRSNEAWTVKDSERSWKLLDKIKRSADWYDFTEFGPRSLSNAPAYGDYEILPVECELDALLQYEYLIFLGWNTMTDEIYEKLTEYVRRGGKLLISAAHLNTNTKRDGSYRPIKNGRVSELVGCDIVGSLRTDSAVQFIKNSSVEGVTYPCANTGAASCSLIDPLFTNGYVSLAALDITSATPVALSNDRHVIKPTDPPLLLENRLGEGTVFFVPSLDYPANGAISEFYAYVVKALFTASHRTADVQVMAADKIAFNVYANGDGGYKVYLLNTDFELPAAAKILFSDKETELTLKPLERREITLR